MICLILLRLGLFLIVTKTKNKNVFYIYSDFVICGVVRDMAPFTRKI